MRDFAPYLRERRKQEGKSNTAGVILSLAVHAALAAVLVFTVIPAPEAPDPLPLPQRDTLEVFEIETEMPHETPVSTRGIDMPNDPSESERNPEKSIASESPAPTPENVVPKAGKPDDFGTTEVPVKKEEVEIDANSLFPGASSKDDAPVTMPSSPNKGTSYQAGDPNGDTRSTNWYGYSGDRGFSNGAPARPRLSDRTENISEDGIVTVSVIVEPDGTVRKGSATITSPTTASSQLLKNAAVEAAERSLFKAKANAVAEREKITYKFSIR